MYPNDRSQLATVESPDRYVVFIETTGQPRKRSHPNCRICHHRISESDQTVIHYEFDILVPPTLHESCLTDYMEIGHKKCPCCDRIILTLLSLPNIPFVTRLGLPYDTTTTVIVPLAKDWVQYYNKLKNKDIEASDLGVSLVIEHGQKVEHFLKSYELERASEGRRLDQAIASISQEIDAYITKFNILCALGGQLRHDLVCERNGKQVGRPRPVRDERVSRTTKIVNELLIGNRFFEARKQSETIGTGDKDKDFHDRIISDYEFVTRREKTNQIWIQEYCQRSKARLEANKQIHLQAIAQMYQNKINLSWLELCDSHVANEKAWKWPREPPPRDRKLNWNSLRRWAITKRTEIVNQAMRNPFPQLASAQEGFMMLYGSRSASDAADDAILRGSGPRGHEQIYRIQRITEGRLARLGFKYL